MEPIEFKQQTSTLAKDQPEFINLPVHMNDTETISCWNVSLIERLKILFTGKLWLRQLTFGRQLQAQLPQADNPFNDRREELPC